MDSNLIDFSKFTPNKQSMINNEAAKKYFIAEVLPYVCGDSLQRLITANISGNSQVIQIEMKRVFIEAELMRPTNTDTNSLQTFFDKPKALS
jgi:hypothetical protein